MSWKVLTCLFVKPVTFLNTIVKTFLEALMKFVLLIYQGSTPLPGSDRWKEMPEEEQKSIYSEYAEFNKTPNMIPGAALGLPTSAKTVQVSNGRTKVTDGTFLDQGIGGYCVFEAENMDAAIALAARIPAARLGGAVEIRPVEQYW
jgi:hypothetical protein